MTLIELIRHPRRTVGLRPAAVKVRVRGGYHPDVIYAAAGYPIRITFRREETAACSASVVFPDFGKCVTLPPYADVTVELPPSAPGMYPFTCQAGILTGRLVVLSAGDNGTSGPAAA